MFDQFLVSFCESIRGMRSFPHPVCFNVYGLADELVEEISVYKRFQFYIRISDDFMVSEVIA